MSNITFVKSNYNKRGVYVLDFDEYKQVFAEGSQLQISDTVRKSLKESRATLVFKNTQSKVYGYLLERRDKHKNLQLCWVLTPINSEVEKVNNSHKIFTLPGDKVIDIDKFGDKLLDDPESPVNKFKHEIIYRQTPFGVLETENRFRGYLRGENSLTEEDENETPVVKKESIKVEKESIEVKNDTEAEKTETPVEKENALVKKEISTESKESTASTKKEVHEDTNVEAAQKHVDAILNAPMQQAVDKIFSEKMDELLDRELALREKEKEIDSLKDKLANRLDGLDNVIKMTNGIEADAKIIGVTHIDKFNEEEVIDDIDSSDIAYETALKLMDFGDIITIPLKVFKKYTMYAKKAIESNRDYTIYRILAVVKFDSKANREMLALCNFDETVGKVRIQVARKYMNKAVSEQDIVEYYDTYIRG